MTKTSPAKFIQEVKSETQKVTWPSRKEMIASTIAVFIMVTIVSIFLFFADQILAWGIDKILTLGSNL